MSQQSTTNAGVLYTITSEDGNYTATFLPARGGLLSSLRAHGYDVLYQHDFIDKTSWPDLPGGMPFLFPICARLSHNDQLASYLYSGQVYRMPIHGVGWWQAWQVINLSKDSITLQLEDTPASRVMYPFEFSVRLYYKLSRDGLSCQQTYHNRSAQAMPYYAGFHPYLHVPVAEKPTTMLEYHPIKHLLCNESLTEVIGEQPLFDLPVAVATPALNEQLTQIVGGEPFGLHYADGHRITLQVTSESEENPFSYIQLYTIEDHSFFCVEPWMAPPNSLNNSGARWLPPDSQDVALLKINLTH